MEKKDIQDIFLDHLQTIKNSNLPNHVKKTAEDISHCRTNAMHGHVYQCPDQHFTTILRNSCNNRNCPTCQTHHKISWNEKTKNLALNTSHYHIVMKFPSFFNQYFLKNYKEFIDILYDSGKKTILKILKYSQYELSNPGIIMVIHTYGEENQLHPHLHIIMTGGGLSKDGMKWIDYDNSLFTLDNFNLFYHAILQKELLRFSKNNQSPGNEIKDIIKNITKHNLFVSTKYPNADTLINYLTRTVKGTSIQNKDIINIQDSQVNFKTKSEKVSSLNEEEFIRRYLIHVLPPKLKAIRYSGLYSSTSRKKLIIAKNILNQSALQDIPEHPDHNNEINEEDILPYKYCPVCKKKMELIEKILPFSVPHFITNKFGKDPPIERLFTDIAA